MHVYSAFWYIKNTSRIHHKYGYNTFYSFHPPIHHTSTSRIRSEYAHNTQCIRSAPVLLSKPVYQCLIHGLHTTWYMYDIMRYMSTPDTFWYALIHYPWYLLIHTWYIVWYLSMIFRDIHLIYGTIPRTTSAPSTDPPHGTPLRSIHSPPLTDPTRVPRYNVIYVWYLSDIVWYAWYAPPHPFAMSRSSLCELDMRMIYARYSQICVIYVPRLLRA